MNELASNLMYLARVVLLFVGCGVGIIKIVKGKSDENPRDMTEGFTVIGAAGAIFAATFAIEAIF